jgi:hypothetical protein
LQLIGILIYNKIIMITIKIKLVALYTLMLIFAFPAVMHSQSVLQRTPNISDGWVPDAVQFNFMHRMWTQEIGDDTRILASPAFLLGMPVTNRGMTAIRYAPNSTVVQAHELEIFGRWLLSDAGEGLPIGIAVNGGYNMAATSVDGELLFNWQTGRFILLGAARAFSGAYQTDDFRVAFGGGLVVGLTSSIALAADIISLTNLDENERVAWGAGLQLRVPASPHTFSVQVTNARTPTLQGSSRGHDTVTWGFEFTMPMTFLGSGIAN